MAKQTKRSAGTPDQDTVVKNAGPEEGRRPSLQTPLQAQTNSQVKSGGNEDDDLVDEQSKESFPSSDAPGNY